MEKTKQTTHYFGPFWPHTLAHLRDEAIRLARASLDAGEWRSALTALHKAAMYDDHRAALERGDDPAPGY